MNIQYLTKNLFKKKPKYLKYIPFLKAPWFPVGGLLDKQYPVYCGGAHASWDKVNDYEPGCFKMYESTPFQVSKAKKFQQTKIKDIFLLKYCFC